jgi:hypothetical protein
MSPDNHPQHEACGAFRVVGAVASCEGSKIADQGLCMMEAFCSSTLGLALRGTGVQSTMNGIGNSMQQSNMDRNPQFVPVFSSQLGYLI